MIEEEEDRGSPMPCWQCGRHHFCTDTNPVLVYVAGSRERLSENREQYLFLCSLACLRATFFANRFAGKDVLALHHERYVGRQTVVDGVTFQDVLGDLDEDVLVPERFLVDVSRGRFLLDSLDGCERSLRKVDSSAADTLRRFASTSKVGDVLTLPHGVFVRVRVSDAQRAAGLGMWKVKWEEGEPSSKELPS